MGVKSKYAQLGVITEPTNFVEYMTFVLRDSSSGIREVLGEIFGIEKSIAQKDSTCKLSVSIGFSSNAWDKVFSDIQKPKELHDFIHLKNEAREFPGTKGDIFVMIKSQRVDLNFQCAKYIKRLFDEFAELEEDIQGYKYLDSRDMIDFVDGTENPKDKERLEAVLVQDDADIHKGGSYLIVQKYIAKENLRPWDEKPTAYQEQVIGRTKMDNIELSEDAKPAWAHTAKSKVERDGEEIKMFRQNRPFGTAKEHGTMFVGFASSPSVIETSLKQMITADENGNYDRLLDFVEAKTGCLFFMPSAEFLNELAEG